MKPKNMLQKLTLLLLCAGLIVSLLAGCAKSSRAGSASEGLTDAKATAPAASGTPAVTEKSPSEAGTEAASTAPIIDSGIVREGVSGVTADFAGRSGSEPGSTGPWYLNSGSGSDPEAPAEGEDDAPGETTPEIPPETVEFTEPIGEDPSWTEPDPQPLVLTAAEWNDNANWAFFTNLVSADKIRFPAFGVDPRNRIAITLTDAAGTPLVNEDVVLCDAEDSVLWRAKTDARGVAYLFFHENETPDYVLTGEVKTPVNVGRPNESGQGTAPVSRAAELTIVAEPAAQAQTALQVMFIVDTTGSMADELCYLQMDFSKIAEDVGNSGVTYSACFYRDEGDDYVTRVNPFTADIAEVQRLINAETAEGGGDTPEAVAEILTETLSPDAGWSADAVKLAFLIFDAPPHDQKEAELDAAIKSAAEQGIRLIPVVASNADRETELFGRAAAICTNGTYVFLTDDSGVGGDHLEPIVGDYEVELLHDLIVRIIESYRVG